MYFSTSFLPILCLCTATTWSQESSTPTAEPFTLSIDPDDPSTTTRDAIYWLAGSDDFQEQFRGSSGISKANVINSLVATGTGVPFSAIESVRSILATGPIEGFLYDSLTALYPSEVVEYESERESIISEIYQTFDPNSGKDFGTNTLRWSKGLYGFSNGMPASRTTTATTLSTTSDSTGEGVTRSVVSRTTSNPPTATSTGGGARIGTAECWLPVGACAAMILL